MRGTQLAPGQVLRDRYHVVGRIGQGAAGAVYRVFDAVTSQHRALKQPWGSAPSCHVQFTHEAALVAQLHHRSLPSATDFFVEAGQPLLVMPLLLGPDLAHLLTINGRPLGVRRVLKWADELLDALHYLHVRGIVHHDVKPRNTRLDSSKHAVLVDLGLAQQTSIRQRQYAPGYTATYAPPEQVRALPTDARSDVYALGATLYELLARRSPPPALHRLATLDARGCDPLLPLERVNPDVPIPVQMAITRALALDPDHRPADAREMQRELRDAALSYRKRAPIGRMQHEPIVFDAHAATVIAPLEPVC